MFTAVFIHDIEIWKQHKCPPTDGQIKMCNTHTHTHTDTHTHTHTQTRILLDWPKCSFGFSTTLENWNELFGEPNMLFVLLQYLQQH